MYFQIKDCVGYVRTHITCRSECSETHTSLNANICFFFISGDKKVSERSTSHDEQGAEGISLQKMPPPGDTVEKFREEYSKCGKRVQLSN